MTEQDGIYEREPDQVHAERLEEGDTEAALQAQRLSAPGQAMTEELQQKAFNPDNTLEVGEVRSRVAKHVAGETYESLRMQLNAIMGGYFPWDEVLPDVTDAEKQELANRTSEAVRFFESRGAKPPEQRQVISRMGVDPSTGQNRMTSPGEKINDHGMIEMVDPRYADQVAERMKNIDPDRAKQNMRRTQHLKTLAQVVLNPVQDPSGIGVVHLDDQQLESLTREYDEAKAAGIPDSGMDFIPLRGYAHKLWREGKTPMRPKLSNECGWFQMASNETSKYRNKIACLKSSTLTQKIQVQVPGQPLTPEVSAPIVDQRGNTLIPPQPLEPQSFVSVEQTAPSQPSNPQTSQPSLPSLEELGLPPSPFRK